MVYKSINNNNVQGIFEANGSCMCEALLLLFRDIFLVERDVFDISYQIRYRAGSLN